MHLLRVQGFCFTRQRMSRTQALKARFVPSMQFTAHAVKQNTGLYRCFSCGLPNSTASNTRPTKAAIIPPAPRRTLDRSTHPPYYNRVYKGAAVCPCRGSMPDSAANRRPCQPGGGQRLHLYRVSPAAFNLAPGQQSGRAGSAWHTPPGGAVQRQGYGGRRGTIDGYRRISFRAFAR